MAYPAGMTRVGNLTERLNQGQRRHWSSTWVETDLRMIESGNDRGHLQRGHGLPDVIKDLGILMITSSPGPPSHLAWCVAAGQAPLIATLPRPWALVDPVLFRMFYATGLRLSEALGLELRDFDPARATIEIRDGKNHENRLLPVTGRLAATVDSYIAAAHPCPEPGHKLFHTGDPSRPADKSTVYNRFRRYLADADIPHFPGGPHIHSLRHGFAVANLRRWAADGADLVVMLPYLSAYMGHADLRGTQYYLQLTADAHPEVAAMASARFGYVIPDPPDPPQGARQ